MNVDTASNPRATDLFPSTEEAVRFAVQHTWVLTIPAGEKGILALPDYVVGERFSESVAGLDRGQRSKAWKCVLQVLTGQAATVAAREVHLLRTGRGGENAPWTREDGAICHRASIEANTPNARRLHYWKLPNGQLELSRIVSHDDMNP